MAQRNGLFGSAMNLGYLLLDGWKQQCSAEYWKMEWDKKRKEEMGTNRARAKSIGQQREKEALITFYQNIVGRLAGKKPSNCVLYFLLMPPSKLSMTRKTLRAQISGWSPGPSSKIAAQHL
jgi:hypothetical protein